MRDLTVGNFGHGRNSVPQAQGKFYRRKSRQTYFTNFPLTDPLHPIVQSLRAVNHSPLQVCVYFQVSSGVDDV